MKSTNNNRPRVAPCEPPNNFVICAFELNPPHSTYCPQLNRYYLSQFLPRENT